MIRGAFHRFLEWFFGGLLDDKPHYRYDPDPDASTDTPPDSDTCACTVPGPDDIEVTLDVTDARTGADATPAEPTPPVRYNKPGEPGTSSD